MAIFQIRINKNPVAWVPLSDIDPDNYQIVEQKSPSGLATAYLFRCGSFVHKWDQDEPGGSIEIYEEGALVFKKTGDPYKLIKEIELKPTELSSPPPPLETKPPQEIPTPPPPPKTGKSHIEEGWKPPKSTPKGPTPKTSREKLDEEIRENVGKKPSEIKKKKSQDKLKK